MNTVLRFSTSCTILRVQVGEAVFFTCSGFVTKYFYKYDLFVTFDCA
jgi:hypothetical protein